MSIGHESALLYTLLTFIGWLDVEDLKNFRQLNSKTPGHPERGLTPGVEATTGPLGQGIGNAVGMAISECILRNQFGDDVVNHYTYVLHGDGDIQEPVAQGSIALAGHWGLGKLIAYYDANDAQISGKVGRSDSTDYEKMYLSHGWQVINVDGHNRDQIRSAIRQAQMEYEKPTVIIGKTIMAHGCASMEGDHNTHGAPLPPDEISATKEKLGLNSDNFFDLPSDVIEDFRSSYDYSREEVKAWNFNLSKRAEDKDFKNDWEMAINDALPNIKWPFFDANQEIATRKVWGSVIESLAPNKKTLVGGSADLEPSNVTAGFAKLVSDFTKNNYSGRNFAYGVREFPMGAINNGIAQHGGLKVFGATFFVFSDYERPALRMRALQKLPVISEYTHDSIFVGEDGPTHQPIEHIMSCRMIPNLLVLRPGDANEAVMASKIAFEQTNRPSIILLTRQKIPVFDRNIYPSVENVYKGGYVMKEVNNADITIFSSGSEVWVALDVSQLLPQYKTRVVNMVSWELFDEQSDSYKKEVIGPIGSLKVSIEAGVTTGWQKFTGTSGLNFGIDRFGESAPGHIVADALGLTPSKIAKSIEKHLHTR